MKLKLLKYWDDTEAVYMFKLVEWSEQQKRITVVRGQGNGTWAKRIADHYQLDIPQETW